MSRSAPDSLHQKEIGMAKAKEAAALRLARLDTPTDLSPNAVTEISGALNILLADMFALYLKTKNFHWHMSGPHFRDYHLLLDEQGEQIFGATDAIPNACGRPAGLPSARSARSAACSVSWITMLTTSRQAICSQSCARIT